MLWQIKMKEELGRPATWEEQFEFLGADGVDFVPYNFNPSCTSQSEIYNSYTKEEMLSGRVVYPRCNYLFWKNVYGLKCYFVDTNKTI